MTKKLIITTLATIVALYIMDSEVNAGEYKFGAELRIPFGNSIKAPKASLGLFGQYLNTFNEKDLIDVGEPVLNAELLGEWNGFDVYDASGSIDTTTKKTTSSDESVGGRLGINLPIGYDDGLKFDKPNFELKGLWQDNENGYEVGAGLGWNFNGNKFLVPIHGSLDNLIVGTDLTSPIAEAFAGVSSLDVDNSTSSVKTSLDSELLNPTGAVGVHFYVNQDTGDSHLQ